MWEYWYSVAQRCGRCTQYALPVWHHFPVKISSTAWTVCRFKMKCSCLYNSKAGPCAQVGACQTRWGIQLDIIILRFFLCAASILGFKWTSCASDFILLRISQYHSMSSGDVDAMQALVNMGWALPFFSLPLLGKLGTRQHFQKISTREIAQSTEVTRKWCHMHKRQKIEVHVRLSCITSLLCLIGY